jgi:hypothetical protein
MMLDYDPSPPCATLIITIAPILARRRLRELFADLRLALPFCSSDEEEASIIQNIRAALR